MRVVQPRHLLCVVPQVLYEYWVVATRPTKNGLGMSVDEAEADLNKIVSKRQLVRDERTMFERWKQLVIDHQVTGKTGHDAHLVATMQRHGIGHILTFNVQHFSRFPISVIDPNNDRL